jgi:cytochrome P450
VVLVRLYPSSTKISSLMQYRDFRTASFHRNPYPIYQEIRASGPLVELEPGVFATGQYSAARAVLNDRRLERGVQADGLGRNVGLSFGSQARLHADPQRQVCLRRLLVKSFDAQQMKKLRQTSFDIAGRLADGLTRAAHGDLVANLADLLPTGIICSILDVPQQDTSVFTDAVHHMSSALHVYQMTRQRLDEANQAALGLGRYFASLLEFRRKRPGDDLISQMIAAEDEGQHMTDEEIVANILLLLVSGQEATANMIGNALIALHQHPDQLQSARSDLTLLPRAVKECIRYDSSVPVTTRVALEDLEIAGVYVARDSTIEVFIGAANRDPERFADPDVLNIDRPVEDRPILSFGGGLHSCVGAELVCMEVEAALLVLLTRFPTMQITNLSQLRWRKRNALRGVESLQAVWI